MGGTKKYEAIIFYKDTKALEAFINEHLLVDGYRFKVKHSGSQTIYTSDYMEIRCVNSLSDHMRGYRVDYIAVQEDLTWGDNWPKIRDSVLLPMLTPQILPLDIQIFDGVTAVSE